MQVWSGDPSSCTHQAQQVVAFDNVALSDVNLAHVAGHGNESVAVIDKYRVAIEKQIAGECDGAGCRRHNGGACGGCNIQTAVRVAWLTV